MARAGVQALMFYCNSHVGLALWRTKLAKPHANLRGRDLFGEIVAECRRRRIEPAKAARNFLAHASLLWAYDPLTSAPGTLTAGRATPLRASSDNRDAGEPGREAVQSIRAPAETGSNPAYPPT
jgi:hypothetical protein